MSFLRPGLQGRSGRGSPDGGENGVEQFGDFAAVVDDRDENDGDCDGDDMASPKPPNCTSR